MGKDEDVAKLTASATCPTCNQVIAKCAPEDVAFVIRQHQIAEHGAKP